MKEKEPERYQEYLKIQKERSKKYRETLKKELAKKKPSVDIVEKKARQLAQQRNRQAKYLEKKKFLNSPSTLEKDKLKLIPEPMFRTKKNTIGISRGYADQKCPHKKRTG